MSSSSYRPEWADASLHAGEGSVNIRLATLAHPHPRVTGPWRDASEGRRELLVQCPCTYRRSIPVNAIRVAGTDGLPGFSTLPQLSTTALSITTRAHAPEQNGDLLPSILFTCILISAQSHRDGNIWSSSAPPFG